MSNQRLLTCKGRITGPLVLLARQFGCKCTLQDNRLIGTSTRFEEKDKWFAELVIDWQFTVPGILLPMDERKERLHKNTVKEGTGERAQQRQRHKRIKKNQGRGPSASMTSMTWLMSIGMALNRPFSHLRGEKGEREERKGKNKEGRVREEKGKDEWDEKVYVK